MLNPLCPIELVRGELISVMVEELGPFSHLSLGSAMNPRIQSGKFSQRNSQTCFAQTVPRLGVPPQGSEMM